MKLRCQKVLPVSFRAKKKRKISDQAENLTTGWLRQMFEMLTSDLVPTLQLINWKIRVHHGQEKMCLVLSDGVNATKQVFVYDNLDELVKETPLYSLVQIQSGTVLDGCLLQVEEFEILAHYHEPIIIGKDLKNLDKDFFEQIFKRKNMLTEDGTKNVDHPHYESTPIF